MFRFFVKKKVGDSFLLEKEVVQHLKVVRATHKPFICIFERQFFECILVEDNLLAKIIKPMNQNNEFEQDVILAAAFIETKNWEWMIQKATELGVTKLIPVYSHNVSKKTFDITEKLVRWQKIAIGAAEQSFRNVYPLINQPMKFNDVVKINITNKFIAHEKVAHDVWASFPQNSLFLIGPEGGFTDQEVHTAIENKFEVISLGKRILRAETAALFVLAKVTP